VHGKTCSRIFIYNTITFIFFVDTIRWNLVIEGREIDKVVSSRVWKIYLKL
jgi:hypothetical protein